MSFDQSPPDSQVIEKWFLQNPAVAANTFEIALALGGTVSAGCYTAGVLDFLIEALDQWDLERAADKEAPQHRVILKLLTGTSGGGVNAAVISRALNFEFPPAVCVPTEDLKPKGNPLYDVWVRGLTLGGFLNTNDLQANLVSGLNGAPINASAEDVIRFSGAGRSRSWLASPLRTILTITNLRGVPYKIDFGQTRSQTYIDHADYMRFAIVYSGQQVSEFRPDELMLEFGGDHRWEDAGGNGADRFATWENFSKYARATAAFPVGFPPVQLSRSMTDYKYRVLPRTDESGQTNGFDVLRPDWTALSGVDGTVPERYEFLAVDGGATDNEPIDLARTGLCGILDSNPRQSNEANRAVVLIDPFAGEADLGPSQFQNFLSTLGSIGNTLTQQTRYDTRDLVLAADSNVASRFMITPVRDELTGAAAIASAGLSAFIGFACPYYMHHDFMLGRRNCQEFLRKYFALSEANQIFGSGWSQSQKQRFARDLEPGKLPIIPLLGSAAIEQLQYPWPKGKLVPESYRGAIQSRITALGKKVAPNAFLRWLVPLGIKMYDPAPADQIIDAFEAYLTSVDLL